MIKRQSNRIAAPSKAFLESLQSEDYFSVQSFQDAATAPNKKLSPLRLKRASSFELDEVNEDYFSDHGSDLKSSSETDFGDNPGIKRFKTQNLPLTSNWNPNPASSIHEETISIESHGVALHSSAVPMPLPHTSAQVPKTSTTTPPSSKTLPVAIPPLQFPLLSSDPNLSIPFLPSATLPVQPGDLLANSESENFNYADMEGESRTWMQKSTKNHARNISKRVHDGFCANTECRATLPDSRQGYCIPCSIRLKLKRQKISRTTALELLAQYDAAHLSLASDGQFNDVEDDNSIQIQTILNACDSSSSASPLCEPTRLPAIPHLIPMRFFLMSRPDAASIFRDIRKIRRIYVSPFLAETNWQLEAPLRGTCSKCFTFIESPYAAYSCASCFKMVHFICDPSSKNFRRDSVSYVPTLYFCSSDCFSTMASSLQGYFAFGEMYLISNGYLRACDSDAAVSKEFISTELTPLKEHKIDIAAPKVQSGSIVLLRATPSSFDPRTSWLAVVRHAYLGKAGVLLLLVSWLTLVSTTRCFTPACRRQSCYSASCRSQLRRISQPLNCQLSGQSLAVEDFAISSHESRPQSVECVTKVFANKFYLSPLVSLEHLRQSKSRFSKSLLDDSASMLNGPDLLTPYGDTIQVATRVPRDLAFLAPGSKFQLPDGTRAPRSRPPSLKAILAFAST